MSGPNYPVVSFLARIEIQCAFCEHHFKVPDMEEMKDTGFASHRCPECGATYNVDVEVDFYA